MLNLFNVLSNYFANDLGLVVLLVVFSSAFSHVVHSAMFPRNWEIAKNIYGKYYEIAMAVAYVVPVIVSLYFQVFMAWYSILAITGYMALVVVTIIYRGWVEYHVAKAASKVIRNSLPW